MLSDMPHLISAGYIPLGDDYWPLFVIHDSDNHGGIASDLIDKIAELEKLPSVQTRSATHACLEECAHTERRDGDFRKKMT